MRQLLSNSLFVGCVFGILFCGAVCAETTQDDLRITSQEIVTANLALVERMIEQTEALLSVAQKDKKLLEQSPRYGGDLLEHYMNLKQQIQSYEKTLAQLQTLRDTLKDQQEKLATATGSKK